MLLTFNPLLNFLIVAKRCSFDADHMHLGFYVLSRKLQCALNASSDRVGWLTNTYEYVEFSLEGNEINRFHGPPWHPSIPLRTTFAINDRDEVFAAVNQPTQPEPILWRLDRSKREWLPVDADSQGLSGSSLMLGLDGEDLVIYAGSVRGSTIIRFNFLSVN